PDLLLRDAQHGQSAAGRLPRELPGRALPQVLVLEERRGARARPRRPARGHGARPRARAERGAVLARSESRAAGGRPLTRFLLRRGLWFVVTAFVVVTVSFVLMRQVRGGPFDGERAL